MGSDELPRYWQYQGRSRDLLIFDESLISSKSVMVVAAEVENSFDILTAGCHGIKFRYQPRVLSNGPGFPSAVTFRLDHNAPDTVHLFHVTP